MFIHKPKNVSNSLTADQRMKAVEKRKKANEEKWPEMMPAETLRKVFGKKYPEYLYIREIYRVEGEHDSSTHYDHLLHTHFTRT